jgi:tyrosyl-tRNA synthetase
MRNYFTLLTKVEETRIDELLDAQRTHPRDAKVELGRQIVGRFHGMPSAQSAVDEFFRVFGKGKTGLPDDMDEIQIPANLLESGAVLPIDLAVCCGFAASKSEARRLIAESGMKLDGEVISDALVRIPVRSGQVLQRGKRKFVRLLVD